MTMQSIPHYHSERFGTHLGVLEQRQQGQVVVGLRVLDGDLVKAETVQLGRQQVVVGLGRLQVLVSVQPVRVAAAEVHRLVDIITCSTKLE